MDSSFQKNTVLNRMVLAVLLVASGSILVIQLFIYKKLADDLLRVEVKNALSKANSYAGSVSRLLFENNARAAWSGLKNASKHEEFFFIIFNSNGLVLVDDLETKETFFEEKWAAFDFQTGVVNNSHVWLGSEWTKVRAQILSDFSNEVSYEIEFFFSLRDFKEHLIDLRIVLFSTFIISLLCLVIVFRVLKSRFYILLNYLIDGVRRVLNNEELNSEAELFFNKTFGRKSFLTDFRDEYLVSKKNAEELVADQAKVQIARQVAHDIRSPVAALDMIARDLGELAEEKRILIRSAIARIRDIANNLVSKGQETRAFDKGASIELLLPLIDSLVTEKRLQFRTNLLVDIEFRAGEGAYNAFAKLDSSEFKRVISNLVNNSVEAFESNGGRVIVGLSVPRQSEIQLVVSDNGKGIPAALLPKLGVEGATFGKTHLNNSGSGLGVAHAKKTIEGLGGKLIIDSVEGQGTTINIILPRSTPPNWFVSALRLESGTEVVVLDDDQSIHHVWRARFNSAGLVDLKTLHLSRPEQLEELMKNSSTTKRFYLFDYELIGFKETGLSLIEKFHLSKQAILVTSRYEEPELRQRCQQLGLKLIPKNFVSYLPIQCSVENSSSLDLILIDDDPLIQSTWSLLAADNKHRLHIVKTVEQCHLESCYWPKFVPIYLDLNIETPLDGLALAKWLEKQGFQNIHLATGESATNIDLQGLEFIKSIQGKDYPL